ncbi:hypothetical protein D3C74_437090 [compost metagenome]
MNSNDELVAANEIRKPTQFVAPALMVTVISSVIIALTTYLTLHLNFISIMIQAGEVGEVDTRFPMFEETAGLMSILLLVGLSIAIFMFCSFVRTWNYRYIAAANSVVQARQAMVSK